MQIYALKTEKIRKKVNSNENIADSELRDDNAETVLCSFLKYYFGKPVIKYLKRGTIVAEI